MATDHELHHQHLAELQEQIERIEMYAYATAKKHRNPAPRKAARRASYSHRVSQAAAWRSHLLGKHHGVKDLGPFEGTTEMQVRHRKLHRLECPHCGSPTEVRNGWFVDHEKDHEMCPGSGENAP